MTRPHCAFCFLPTEAVRRIRHKRCGLVWVCSSRKHLGCVETLTPRRKQIAARRMVVVAMGGVG